MGLWLFELNKLKAEQKRCEIYVRPFGWLYGYIKEVNLETFALTNQYGKFAITYPIKNIDGIKGI